MLSKLRLISSIKVPKMLIFFNLSISIVSRCQSSTVLYLGVRHFSETTRAKDVTKNLNPAPSDAQATDVDQLWESTSCMILFFAPTGQQIGRFRRNLKALCATLSKDFHRSFFFLCVCVSQINRAELPHLSLALKVKDVSRLRDS